ncbi:MAG: guanylate kinase [Planctomycetes bacterium]|nr:guanylate kinase [Planctomycetota bacterium]
MNEPASQLAPLVVVSGPSGVGKTTVVERLIAREAPRLRRAVTATTRPERAGEVAGTDYHFWTVERFQTEVRGDNMLEWARVFGNDFYGTPRSEVDPHRAAGTGVVLVIDVQGAARVRELGLEHLSVFIDPPSLAELEARLRGRGDMAEERVQRRLAAAVTELDEAAKFDCRIVNRDLADAVTDLQRAIRARFNLGEPTCSTN